MQTDVWNFCYLTKLLFFCAIDELNCLIWYERTSRLFLIVSFCFDSNHFYCSFLPMDIKEYGNMWKVLAISHKALWLHLLSHFRLWWAKWALLSATVMMQTRRCGARSHTRQAMLHVWLLCFEFLLLWSENWLSEDHW